MEKEIQTYLASLTDKSIDKETTLDNLVRSGFEYYKSSRQMPIESISCIIYDRLRATNKITFSDKERIEIAKMAKLAYMCDIRLFLKDANIIKTRKDFQSSLPNFASSILKFQKVMILKEHWNLIKNNYIDNQ